MFIVSPSPSSPVASPSASDSEPAASAVASRVAKEGLVLRPDFLLLTDATLSSRRRLLRGRSETVSSPAFLHFLGRTRRLLSYSLYVAKGKECETPVSFLFARKEGKCKEFEGSQKGGRHLAGMILSSLLGRPGPCACSSTRPMP